MIASRSASRRSSRLPERSFSGGYGSPAPWEIGAGLARLRQLLRCGHEDASPHKWGGDREHGHRCWKKALKRRRLALKSRHRRWSSAYPTARRRILRVGVTAARRRARGETVPQASRASLPPVPVPNPLGRGAGGRRPKLYDAARFGRAS
jgi:hypothetical protein